MKLTIDGLENISKNKYFNLYCKIIQNRKNNPLEGMYVEKHHIIPVKMGGKNDVDNLVSLSAREHYICHYLLTKFSEGKSYYKMLFAFKAMNMKNDTTTKDRYFNSRLYEASKKDFSVACSNRSKEWWKDENNKIAQSKRIKESWKNGKRDIQLEDMRMNSPFKNKEIHSKSIQTREINGTNVFVTNNPMFDDIKKQKKIEKTSGNNHYLRNKRKFFYKKCKNEEWIIIDTVNGLKEGLSKIGLNISTYNLMLQKGENYTPKRGPMKGMYAKRICL